MVAVVLVHGFIYELMVADEKGVKNGGVTCGLGLSHFHDGVRRTIV